MSEMKGYKDIRGYQLIIISRFCDHPFLWKESLSGYEMIRIYTINIFFIFLLLFLLSYAVFSFVRLSDMGFTEKGTCPITPIIYGCLFVIYISLARSEHLF